LAKQEGAKAGIVLKKSKRPGAIRAFFYAAPSTSLAPLRALGFAVLLR
jgi:hypothetical protein